VTIFVVALRTLPAETMKLGRWTISRGGQFTDADNEAGPKGGTGVEESPNVRARSSSNAIKTTSVASKRTKPRPPDIIITRDSFESVYSVYDEEPVQEQQHQRPVAHTQQPWSADGPRHRRY
jgi:hypothetical protein